MILVDANLLIYAVNREAPPHHEAKKWLESVLAGSETVGFASIALVAFLRISTRRGAFSKELTVVQALDIVDGWLEQPTTTLVHPGRRHNQILRGLLVPLKTGGNLINDAQLAALAIENEAALYTADADFARFRGLRWRNPLR